MSGRDLTETGVLAETWLAIQAAQALGLGE
ncbi:hypothetical protein AB0J38_24480 [Streptomyces sp. NPDC050095]